MANKYSFVTLSDGRHKTVSREQGIRMQKILDGELEPDNEQQAEFLLHVKHIDPRTSHGELIGRAKQVQAVKTSHLTNEGVPQSMYDAIPRGDR